jgi:hypothetical protein
MQFLNLNELTSGNSNLNNQFSYEKLTLKFDLSSIYDEQKTNFSDISSKIHPIEVMISRIHILNFKKDSILIEEGCKSDSTYFLIDDFLKAFVRYN